MIAALPKPDVTLDAAFPRLNYTHRTWRDAEMYFFFNESDKEESRTATIAGHGQAQVWDLGTGEIHPIAAAVVAQGDSVRVPLLLGPYEAKVIVVGPPSPGVAAPEPPMTSATSLLDLAVEPSGPNNYRKQFTAPAAPAGKRLYLEIGRSARLRPHHTERQTTRRPRLAAVSLDITTALKPGANDLEIQVLTTPAGGRGGRGAPPPPASPLGASA